MFGTKRGMKYVYVVYVEYGVGSRVNVGRTPIKSVGIMMKFGCILW